MTSLGDNLDAWTDHYFLKSQRLVQANGDAVVTYAVFMRRPVLLAPRLMLAWMREVAQARGFQFEMMLGDEEGSWIGAGDPVMMYRGKLSDLVVLETLLLQKIGAASVAAAQAYQMCCDLPKAAFLAMDARHCAGTEMAEMMAYAASVGSTAARKSKQARGFVGNATQATAHYFGNTQAMGTIPHAFIGYAGSTLAAAQQLHALYPDDPLTVLVDYFGREITDAIELCQHFPELAAAGKLAVRLDTHGSRYCEGLDPTESYAVLEACSPESFRGYRNDAELNHLIGSGVSAAAVWHMRRSLDTAGYPAVKIVASSGFSPMKCRVMGSAGAPIDVVGTGSFLPEQWSETYATADVIAYDGVERVKVGREFLFAAFARLQNKRQWVSLP